MTPIPKPHHTILIRDEKLFYRAKTRAAYDHMTLAELTERALMDYLKRKPKGE